MMGATQFHLTPFPTLRILFQLKPRMLRHAFITSALSKTRCLPHTVAPSCRGRRIATPRSGELGLRFELSRRILRSTLLRSSLCDAVMSGPALAPFCWGGVRGSNNCAYKVDASQSH